ncbi:protein MRVI1-like isoform X2 [Thrips palmi]|uniref:Protein MRVI1-like isoform X2 n=1 Tax=Thrips palmi TaxID=161013 RepID=A0A6P8ZHV5_THRPL|nr:protein MRVI1-like isoform X2 [Thrips palmi]
MLEGPEPPVQLASKEEVLDKDKQAAMDYPVFPSLRDEDLERLGVLAAQAARSAGQNQSQQHQQQGPGRPATPSSPSPSSSPVGSPAANNGFGGSVSDKDIESKFTALSLAFKTDKMTLGQRLLRQQRQRDLAENNMSTEFNRLLDIHKRLSRAASDAERGDFLDRFRTQLEALDHASRQVSSAAEMYGAVQQEDRLSHAMEVIDLYVESLKRLHQKLCQELEEKKRVLSENNIVMEELQDMTDEPPPRTTRYRSLSALASNPLAGTKRRASIAAMPRPGSLGSQPANGDVAVLSRSPGSGSQVLEGRSGRWSAPSRVRRVSLALDQSPTEAHPPSPGHAGHPADAGRRDSRVDAYAHSAPSSCMSEIAELSESRRESAAETAEEDALHARPDSCLLAALGQNGAVLHHDDEDDDEDQHEEHLRQLQHLQHLQQLQANGVCRTQGAPDSLLDRLALLLDCWGRGREMASELWYLVSKDSFRWLRLWTVCALLVASLAVLVTTLIPTARQPAAGPPP